MATVAERLASWVVGLHVEELPTTVVERARYAVLDQLGVQLRGATLPVVEPALRLVRAMRSAPESTVVFHGDRCTGAYAAYANAAFGHSCELDDAHLMSGHPGAVVVPTALAVGEQQRSTGTEVVRAIVAGYQVMALALGPIHRRTLELGWHGMKIAGVFGAASTAGVLLRLDREQLVDALAIAASDASGTMEYDQSGGEVKRLHAAMAARSGIQAALLARDGMTGPNTVFEGRRGIYPLFGAGAQPTDKAVWSGRFHILDTIVKLHPCVGTNHAPLDALDLLLCEHEFGAADVRAITVSLAAEHVAKASAIVRPHDQIGAQTSLAFNLALLLAYGDNDLGRYLDPATWRDPAVLAIAEKVSVKPDDIATTGTTVALGANVDVELSDGRIVSRRVDAFRGHPDNPAESDELVRKFRGLVTPVIGHDRADAIVLCVSRLETLEDISHLVTLLA